jgi:hypothetical protein
MAASISQGFNPTPTNPAQITPQLTGKTILYDRQGSVTNAAATVRTVTAGKTYYMVAYGLSYYASSNDVSAALYITNSNKYLVKVQTAIDSAGHDSNAYLMNFALPIPIAASTSIVCESFGAGCTIAAWVIGYEE